MKSKMLIVAFIAILICSAFSMAPTMAKCPKCGGTGEIECRYCDGTGEITIEEGEPCGHCEGSGALEPNLLSGGRSHWLSDGKVSFQVTYENEEDVNVHGKVIAEVEAESKTYTGTSADTTFPPHEQIKVAVTVGGISSADYLYLQNHPTYKTSVTLEVGEISCPYCEGTGVAPSTQECPYCGGTGDIDCPTCGGTGVEAGEQNGALDIGGAVYGIAAVVAVAGVAIAAFVVVKKKTVKESDLRKLPPTEFQNWVLKRAGGKASSQSDARIGIDGYTIEGQPISIKQADGVDRNVLENFAAAMGRHNAKSGTIVAFSFSDDAIRGRVRAKMAYGREIQMVTVKELIESRNRTL
jgi:hypothetical protein